MSQELSKAIEEHFKSLSDPLCPTANQRHNFVDILVIGFPIRYCFSGRRLKNCSGHGAENFAILRHIALI